jgi:hypothetical protein
MSGFTEAGLTGMPLSPSHAAALEYESPPHPPIAAEAEDEQAGAAMSDDWDLVSNADTELCEELEREQIRDEIFLNGGWPTDEQLQRLGSLRRMARDVPLTAPLMSSFGPYEPPPPSAAPAASNAAPSNETWSELRLLECVALLGGIPGDDKLSHLSYLRARKPCSPSTPKIHSAF